MSINTHEEKNKTKRRSGFRISLKWLELHSNLIAHELDRLNMDTAVASEACLPEERTCHCLDPLLVWWKDTFHWPHGKKPHCLKAWRSTIWSLWGGLLFYWKQKPTPPFSRKQSEDNLNASSMATSENTSCASGSPASGHSDPCLVCCRLRLTDPSTDALWDHLKTANLQAS